MVKNVKKYFYVLLCTSVLTCMTSVKALGFIHRTIKSALHWTISAGPLWLEAYQYAKLLPQEQALSELGTNNLNTKEEDFIRITLQELDYTHYKTIPVKILNADKQQYVQSALICTDNALFVNQIYYQNLTKKEKKAIIAHAVTMMNAHHTLSNALVLAGIPACTHIAIKTYQAGIREIIPACIKNNRLCSLLFKTHDFITGSCITKSVINYLLAAQYFKWKSKKYDIESAEKYQTHDDLLSYYTKMNKQTYKDLELLSPRQPTLQERIGYLTALASKKAE